MITYNTFIQRFKDFADNHYFIRSFSHGAPEDVDLDKQNEYPLMHVIYTGAGYEDTTKTLSFEVYIFDLPSHYENKQDRQKEVVSDAEQCAEDVIADIVNGGNIFLHSEDYTIASARVSPLLEESSNVLAGVLLEVDVQIPYDRDACNAPIDGVSPEGGEIVYARRGVLRVRTVDSATDVQSVRTIVVPNGKLTDNGGGQVTLDFSSVSTLNELTDVNLDEPLDREGLVYDETSSQWINGGIAKVDFPVYYSPGTPVSIGKVVGFTGAAQGDRPSVSLFSASSTTDPKTLVGITMEAISGRSPGHVRTFGTIYGVNTAAYTVGTVLYASTTAGELTSTAPSTPNHRIAVAVVTRQHINTGRIFVRMYTPAYRLTDLSDVTTFVSAGQTLAWDAGNSRWMGTTLGSQYISGSPPPGGFTPAVFYRDGTGAFATDEDLTWVAGTNTLTTINVTGSGVVKGTNTYGARFATEAATNRALANATGVTVERYFTCTAEGNGESFNIQSNTPSAGNKIVRKIWYKAEAFEATDVDTWTLLHTFADDATYASTATKWQEYLDGQANGTPPFTLAISWEDIPAFTGLLDTYSGAAAAYSLRLLDSTYTGDAIRVRRASDNTEQDIGFDVNGDLDTSALTTFCTGTNGFVKTWYDQSGNAKNATQSTTANQPKIYDSSTGVVTKNGKPAIQTTRASQHRLVASSVTLVASSNFAAFAVYEESSSDLNNSGIFFSPTQHAMRTAADLYASYYYNGGIFSGNFVSGVTDVDDIQLVSSHADGTNLKIYTNGGNEVSSALLGTLDTTAGNLNLGNNDFGERALDGYLYEMIFYTSNQLSNRTGIQTNINTYYSIY
jgi:hypothetical protein